MKKDFQSYVRLRTDVRNGSSVIQYRMEFVKRPVLVYFIERLERTYGRTIYQDFRRKEYDRCFSYGHYLHTSILTL